MQISIQSLETEFNKTRYRFIVKRVNGNNNEIVFHCWAPDDSIQAKNLINNEVLIFEWDRQREELKPRNNNDPVSDHLRQAIQAALPVEALGMK